MKIFRKKKVQAAPQERMPHPDPGIERQLQHILALQRVVSSAEEQVESYQRSINDCHQRVNSALSNRNAGYSTTTDLKVVTGAAEHQIDRSNEGIREQRAVIKSVLTEIEQKTGELSAYDLAYLDMSDNVRLPPG